METYGTCMGKFYVDGNVIEGNKEVTKDNWTKGIYEQIKNSSCDNTFTKQVKEKRCARQTFGCRYCHYNTAEQAYDLVLAHAGCSKQRDIIDICIIEETQNGTATYIGSVTKRR